jgi:hypothetical protein
MIFSSTGPLLLNQLRIESTADPGELEIDLGSLGEHRFPL